MEPIPQALQDLLPGYAARFNTEIGNVFWRRMMDGYPPEVEGMSRRLTAEHMTIMETRRFEDVPYNLFLRRTPPADNNAGNTGNAPT